MSQTLDLSRHEIDNEFAVRNAPPAALYEDAISVEHAAIANSGALIIRSGKKTGRSPLDKRIVDHPDSSGNIWWGPVNIKLEEHVFVINRQRAIDYLNTRDQLYVCDGFAGWDPRYRVKVRVICARAYHALFMRNMLIRPTATELEQFGEPDYVIYNAGQFPANPHTHQMTSRTSIDISLERREMVILGTEYAGEMKKGVFTLMHYVMPARGVLSMHCSANEGASSLSRPLDEGQVSAGDSPRRGEGAGSGDVSLFFGLSGTGKTTLSADPCRRLIGDDEHCWSDHGIFNIEGGCYAKCIGLTRENEPEIYDAIRFGTVLENVVFNEETRAVDFENAALTENTRAAYPIEYIDNAKVPCVGGHPRNIIFLTCDAFGVIPPVSRLTPEQAMYHFISGYTARVAGTEVGVKEPQVAFSACYSAAFLVRHPTVYATMLAERLRKHRAQAWLVNTGWSGGAYGVGSRIPLVHTRAIIDAIHCGALNAAPTQRDPHFKLDYCTRCPSVPEALLQPAATWKDRAAYEATAQKLAALFRENFAKYASPDLPAMASAGP
ncbi:MAG TPA: phosphoenolpyruvate carboxykinase (ATP) [Pirellulales bacterium]|jgi:phosphoenolpyruvate carboxykinase (ATP)|nr:phosphoenolpyruvate carboxykinase (ATP) [Pirellulales bacterium]